MTEFYVSPLLSEGAVLQREEKILIRGGGQAGAEVEAELTGPGGDDGGRKRYFQSTTVGADGTWRLFFNPLPAGGPYCLACSSGSSRLEIRDIWMGDVWLLAGQSNMQLPMERVKYRFAGHYRNGGLPMVRQFSVPIGWKFESLQEELTGGTWSCAVKEATAAFSAVGYFFGRTLFENCQVPVGLILTAVGGTPIQAWMSRESLADFPEELGRYEACMAPGYVAAVQKQDEERIRDWWNRLDEADAGFRESRIEGQRKTISLSERWEGIRELQAPGAVWLRKEVRIPKERAGVPVRISLGTIMDADVLYVNGTAAGTTGYRYPPREYGLEGLLPGSNTLLIKVVAVHGTGGFTRGKRHVILWEDGVAEDISDGWEYCRGVQMEPLEEQTFFERMPVGMYQGMVAPLQEFPIKGICWYQGEMNADEYEAYPGYFSRMVSDWRNRWRKSNLPVLFVQLPNYELEDAGNWVEFREAQRRLADIPHTAMVVTVDCGEANDLHPTDKKTVGERLAMAALHMAYKDGHGGLSPLLVSAEKGRDSVRLHFRNADGGLETADGKEPAGFEYLYGTEEPVKRVEAKVRLEGEDIVAELPGGKENFPSALVYAWKQNPVEANVCNGKQLPVSPFRCEL